MGVDPRPGKRQLYRAALLDWLACAVGGADQSAARAAAAAGEGALERVAFLGAAGHVLDFDDTYLPGLAHLSAPVAPAALGLGAALGTNVGDALIAYSIGFETMGRLARGSHPALYEQGWHPTAVCGAVGAAAAAASLLRLGSEGEAAAVGLALLRAGGLRAAFGSDGKALQVGIAAAEGVHAARLVAAGAKPSASVMEGPFGFEDVFGGAWPPEHAAQRDAIEENWTKPWPCCLMAHSAIEAASSARQAGLEAGAAVTVTVHPRARSAAAYDDVADGLQAKFSLPYLVAFTLLRGEPDVESFAGVDPQARALAGDRVALRLDDGLAETEAVLHAGEDELARVRHSLGSPERPMSPGQVAAKARDLSGERLEGALDDEARPVADVLAAAGL